MRNIICILVILISLSSCHRGGYIALQDAERGMFLDRAKTKSVDTFFDRRMESELENSYKRDWYIVNEDLEYIYFGLLIKQNGFTIIKPFYKVNRDKLTQKFPGFRSIEGKHIKAKVFQTFVKPIIDERLLTICPQSYNIQYSKRQYNLTNDGIQAHVEFTGRCYENKIFNAQVKVLLDAMNMDIINSETNYK